MSRSLRRSLAVALALPIVGACGGGGEPSGPPPVATVTVSALAQSLTVGQSLQLSVSVADAKGNPVTDRAIGYQSSAPEIATVSTTGSVLGVTPGSVTITATAGGRSGTLALTVKPIPVAAVLLTPRGTSLRVGESVTISATPVDITGATLSGRPVTFESASPTLATVTSAGVVTAVAPGSVYIRATSEAVTDSALVRVRNLNAPAITGASPATLRPGIQATLTGANFSNAAADVVVLVNGAVAPVSAATTTSVTFTVPAALALPCSATGPQPLAVVVNGDTATFSHPLAMATQRSLAVGQSLLLTSSDQVACNEFPQNGGRYLFTVFNAAQASTQQIGFRLDGGAGAATGPAVGARVASLAIQPPARTIQPVDPRDLSLSRLAQTAHERAMDLNSRFLQSHGSPLRGLRAQRQSVARLGVQGAIPAVGDMRTFRFVKSFASIDIASYDSIRARAVYVGSKMIVYEDSLAPLARQMDADYQAIGQEFDTKMYPILSSFGDPLVLDGETDQDGHIIALFSKKVNDLSPGLLGFVGSWDFWPQTGTNAVPLSNSGEYFYAAVPDPASNLFKDAETWKRYLRGVLAHEAKHIVGFAERISRTPPTATRIAFEERWLEEATAQMASEMWARGLYGKPWKGNIAWQDGPRCDYVRTIGGTCTDNARGVALHYDWLYTFMSGNERRTVISNSSSDGASLYGGAWLFTRWLTDWFSNGDEAAFTRALVQQANDVGVTNIMNRTGRTFEELLGLWSLSTLVDDLPGFSPADPRLTMPSWNVRDIFAGMNTLRFTDGTLAYPRLYPLGIRTMSYGAFGSQNNVVSGLPGGAFAAFELSGTQSGPQTIGVRDLSGGLASPRLGLAIVRVQ